MGRCWSWFLHRNIWEETYLTLCDPMDSSPLPSSVLGILQARLLEWVAISSSRGSSQFRCQICISCISCITGRLFTCWATGEAPWIFSPWNSPGQNTGVGSLSFLQGIFPTQGSNPGLSHCRWILYQLSHKGSPRRDYRGLEIWRLLITTSKNKNNNIKYIFKWLLSIHAYSLLFVFIY